MFHPLTVALDEYGVEENDDIVGFTLDGIVTVSVSEEVISSVSPS